MKALVVDDSKTMRRILINTLNQMGVKEVLEAGDGQEAVKVTETQNVDLILMDWNMPVMTGIDSLKAIRAAGKTMPILMVTTEAEKDRILEAIKSGATNYIIKPFNQNTIMAKIREVLTKAGIKI